MFERMREKVRIDIVRAWALTALGAVLLAGPCLGAQTDLPSTDVLYTRAGEEYVGRLERVAGGKVVFLHEGRGKLTLDAKDVQRVELGKTRQGDHWRKVEHIDDPVLLQALKTAPKAKDYPNSGYVTLYQESRVTLNRDGSARTTQRTIQKVFKERGKSVANKAVYYFTDNSTAAIDFGRTVTSDGKVITLADSAIQDGSVFTHFPDYQNLNRKQAALKEVKPGSVVDYQTTVLDRKTDLVHPFLVQALFGDREPILKKVVSVTVPKDTDCVCQATRLADVSATVRDLPKGMRRYSWTVVNTPELTLENDMPSTEDIWPRLAFAPAATWGELARSYAQRLQPLLKVAEPLADEVKAIIKGQQSDEQKARAIYRYLVKRVRTIPVSFHAYSLVPRDVNTVFGRKYGNDLEKTLLAVAMFRAAGIAADLCLARPQGDGEVMRSVPSLGQFSQCLVRVRSKEHTWYCQVEDEKVPMHVLDGDCQGVFALVVVDAALDGAQPPSAVSGAQPKLVQTPLAAEEEESVQRSLDVTLQGDGTLDVRETICFEGQAAAGTRWLKGMKEAERKRHFQQRVAGIHTNAELVSYRVSDLDDLAAPVEIELHYRLVDYAVRAGDKLMVFRLPGLDYGAGSVGKPTRVHPLDWTTLGMSSHRYVLRLPPGLKVRYLPSEVKYVCPSIGYQAAFRRDGGVITFTDEFRRSRRGAPASEYPGYKAGIEAMAKLAKEWVVVGR